MVSEHVEDPARTTGYDARRLHTHDMEIGVTDAVQRHVQVSQLLGSYFPTSDLSSVIYSLNVSLLVRHCQLPSSTILRNSDSEILYLEARCSTKTSHSAETRLRACKAEVDEGNGR